jgi:hypothetical protein
VSKDHSTFIIAVTLSKKIATGLLDLERESMTIVRNADGHCHNPEGKGKGKAVPLQAWTGPEGPRLPDFKTIGT